MATTDTSGELKFASSAALQHLNLEVSGMTCASCATRIEKKLNRL
ncbi:MAG: cation transporter, partial [Actinomycetes bacterium]